MPSDRKPSLILPVAGAALLLVGGYVGCYFLTVETTLRHYSPRPTGLLHWLDRQVRPNVWRERDKEGPPVI
jgi:hypothetical protein